jgi:metal-responsive CopG/Arc/MetJ family transcriptional regulator
MPRRQTTIRLTESLVDELDREADEQGITRSEHIRQRLSERHETTVNAQRLEREGRHDTTGTTPPTVILTRSSEPQLVCLSTLLQLRL